MSKPISKPTWHQLNDLQSLLQQAAESKLRSARPASVLVDLASNSFARTVWAWLQCRGQMFKKWLSLHHASVLVWENGDIFLNLIITHTEIDNIYIYIVKETQTTKNKWIYYSVQPNSFANWLALAGFGRWPVLQLARWGFKLPWHSSGPRPRLQGLASACRGAGRARLSVLPLVLHVSGSRGLRMAFWSRGPAETNRVHMHDMMIHGKYDNYNCK